jgi:hypothetical protein
MAAAESLSQDVAEMSPTTLAGHDEQLQVPRIESFRGGVAEKWRRERDSAKPVF